MTQMKRNQCNSAVAKSENEWKPPYTILDAIVEDAGMLMYVLWIHLFFIDD